MTYLIFAITTFIYLLLTPKAYAQDGEISQYFDAWQSAIGINTSLTSLSGIINALVPLIIVFSGVILLAMLIYGGFEMLTAAGNPEQAEKGKKRLTTSLIGFIVIFAAYWIIQIMEVILGVNIFG